MSRSRPTMSTSNQQTNLANKMKEYEAVAALTRASQLMVQHLDGIADEYTVMADAAIAHAQVLEQWPRMFQTLSLFLAARENSTSDEPGEKLVRIPIEELQQEGN